VADLKTALAAVAIDVEAVEKSVADASTQHAASIAAMQSGNVALQARNTALEATVVSLQTVNTNLTDRNAVLEATMKTLVARMDSLHVSFGAAVILPEPKQTNPASGGVQEGGAPTIEAAADGMLKINVKAGSRVTVNDEELLTRSEIQGMIQATVEAALAAAAEGSA
jgi:hypothetical protein